MMAEAHTLMVFSRLAGHIILILVVGSEADVRLTRDRSASRVTRRSYRPIIIVPSVE